jgi:putative membrane protein
MSMPGLQSNLIEEKKILRWIYFISSFVFITVIVLNRKILPRPEVVPAFAYYLPALNAIINGTCTVLLLVSLYFIRKKDIIMHKRINLTTFVLSALFLVSYITYHYLADETRYPAGNPVRPWYLALLTTHIILAALVLPMILISFYYGLTMQVSRHRRITRWSYPIWLYVTITGVIVYLMISPFYPPHQ